MTLLTVLFEAARDYTLHFTITHTHTHWCPLTVRVFTSRCLVVALDGGRSPSSGLPNYTRPQLPAPHSSSSQQLNRSGYLTATPNLSNL
jgi:hypothetical protein